MYTHYVNSYDRIGIEKYYNFSFRKYFQNKQIPIIDLTGYQCMTVNIE